MLKRANTRFAPTLNVYFPCCHLKSLFTRAINPACRNEVGPVFSGVYPVFTF